MVDRALTFGSVASDYERYRPGYPQEVVDLVLTYAGGPVRTALEIGAGTGKATRTFAARGILVTATDPDRAMLAELQAHVPDTVTVLRGALEDLRPTQTYDLVYAAASLHWTDPEGRWPRVAALLTHTGVFACFGGRRRLADARLEEAVAAARAPFLADDDVPSPDGTPEDSPVQWPGTELTASELFTDVRQSTIELRPTMSAQDYIGHLSTVSAYLQLPAQVRQQALAAVRAVLPDQVSLAGDITLHLARIAPTP